MDKILEKVKESSAVILGVNVILRAPSGLFKVFLDYLTYSSYKNILKDKYGFCISLTSTNGERETAEYILKSWETLGGIEGGRIPLFIKDNREIEDIKETIEKRIEDFYRICRQKRKKLPSSHNILNIEKKDEIKIEIDKEEKSKITSWTPPVVSEKEEVKSMVFENFSKKQEEDIKELAEFFKKQLIEEKNKKEIKSTKTAKQLTKNLPHYFQPHLAANFKAIFQFHITGEENFESYIIIDQGKCTYCDGVSNKADITITGDETIWSLILKGELSAQKAFMTGQLKVRGNFMLLNKLDQLFKKM